MEMQMVSRAGKLKITRQGFVDTKFEGIVLTYSELLLSRHRCAP